MGIGEGSGSGSGAGAWQHGLFGCFDNCTVCIITYFVPCYTFGKNAESVGESCLLYCIFAIIPILNLICGIMLRGKIREQKGIEGGIVGDVLSWFCCAPCAICQEAQELSSIGGGMAVGGQDVEIQRQ